MRFVKGFGQFWYEFIIGDDWKIAAAVVVALAVVAVMLTAKVFGDHGLAVFGAVLIALLFTVSLVIDVHPRSDG